MDQKKLVIVLADISGYTQFMLENRTAAVHGQLCINTIIEAIIARVDIPLVLQEIEGDAVFLYAADTGQEGDWLRIVNDVSRKLGEFFETFIAQWGVFIESTQCQCAICRNSDKLGLKIIVHAGEATFHEIAGRSQVSSPDVILAHRLLKNSVDANAYLLLTEAAYDALGNGLPGAFQARHEKLEGFDDVPIRVRYLEEDFLNARDAVYDLSAEEHKAAIDGYFDFARNSWFAGTIEQLRNPIRDFGLWGKLMMLFDYVRFRLFYQFYWPPRIINWQRARGKRRIFPSKA